MPLSSQPARLEFDQAVKISSRNFDELIKQSDWLLRSNQRERSKKLLSDLLAFANKHSTLQHLIQVHHAYGSYYRYHIKLDSASFYGDKLLKLVEREGVSDLQKAMVYAFCGELSSVRINASNEIDFKTALDLCEKGLALVKHLKYSPIKTACKYCIEQSLSAFNRNSDYERTHALPKIRQIWFEAIANQDSLNSLKIGIKVLDYCRGLSLFDSARVTMDRLTKLLVQYRNDAAEISILSLKHGVALNQGKLEEARSFLDKAIVLAKKGGFNAHLQHFYLEYSSSFQELNDYENAKRMYDSARLADPERLSRHINWLIAKMYRKQGNLDSTLVYLDKSLSLRDDDFIKKQAEMVEEFKVKHKTQEKEIALQKQRTQKNLFILIAAIVVFIALVLAWAYHNQKIAQDKLQVTQTMVENINEQLRIDKQIISKQADELRVLDQLKSRFFTNVSHELRTPLSLMIGPLDSILKKESDRPAKEQRLLEFVLNNSQHLLTLVNEILDLSKLETGRLDLKEEALNFHDLLLPIMSQFSSFGDSESVKLQFDYQADPGLNILLDANKFEKIVHNFLSNAIKFSSPGAVVKFKVEASDAELLVSVADQGPGIHPDDLPHIFNRFYQSKRLETPAQGGTGIGLSLAAELAELLGGKIWAESEWGKGSIFYFQFPLKPVGSGQLVLGRTAPPPTKMPTLIPTPSPIPNHLTPKPSILIVEDNPDLRAYMQLLLEDEYHVITAENGKAGFDCLLQSASSKGAGCQLIISDLMMPMMGGFQFLEKVKSSDRFRHLPFIILTARADVRVKLQVLRIGVDDYLTKPFVEEELQARVKNLLYKYRERVKALAENDHEEENLLPEKPQIAASDTEWLERVEAVFSKMLSDAQFKMDWVAGQMHLSERQFGRRLKQLTGLTPNNYLREIRLQRARDFLHEGKYTSVKEAGLAVGFSDMKYFSSLFQERFGVVPSAYLS